VPCQGGLRLVNQIHEWFKSDEEKSLSEKEKNLVIPTANLSGAPKVDNLIVDRFDYALQANPLESFNEHISAYRSHFIYWESEDVASFVVDQYMEEIEASRRRARDRIVPGMSRVAISTQEFV